MSPFNPMFYMKRPLFFLLMLLPAGIGFSQKVSVAGVQENRSTTDDYFGNRCEVNLKLSGDEVRRYKYARISSLTKAADDQGFDLIDPEELDFDYEEVDDNFMELKLVLRTTSRKASVIKELKGEIILFNPTEANGGMVNIAGFKGKPNTNLVPASAPFKMVYMDKKAYETFYQSNKDKTEAQLKKMPEATRLMTRMLLEAFDSFSLIDDETNQLPFLVEGDVDKLVDVKFTDADGNPIDTNGTMTMNGNLKIYYFNEEPQPKWKMTVIMESGKSVTKIPFSLADIDLP